MRTLRRIAWTAGVPVRAGLVGFIRLYRLLLSPLMGGQCRFSPSCSHYAEAAIRQRGAVRGIALAAWRILRCNPFGRGGLEPVRGGALYEPVTLRPSEAHA